MSTNIRPFREFWFGWGYVETACYAQLPMRHETGFETFKDAIEHLKATTLKAYNIVHELTDWDGNPTEKALRFCCKQTLNKLGADKSGVNFCYTCGNNFHDKTNKHANPTDMILNEFFRQNIFFGNNDSTPSEIWEIFENCGWSFTEGVSGDALQVESLDRWLNHDYYNYLKWNEYDSKVVCPHDNDLRGEDN